MPDTPEPPDTEPAEPVQLPSVVDTSPKTKGISDAWFGGVIWVTIIIGVVYFSLFSSQVDVLLNVSGADPLVAEGVVTSEGGPVTSGTIQVLVEEPQGERLLTSAVADVSPKGTFRVELRRTQPATSQDEGLRLRATYRGQMTGADKESTSLKGNSIVYVNTTPPWGMNWGFGALVVVLAGLVVLFTGPLPPRKARVLFGVTYVVTFTACVIPIILTVAASRSPSLVNTMRRAPVGIINAKAKGLEDAQWLVNIGGSVNQISTEESGAGGRLLPQGTKTALLSVQPTSAAPAPAPDAAKGTAVTGTAAPSDTPPAPAVANEIPQSVSLPVKVEPLGYEVKGGLAIPLFVIVLAMLGAGINMTRKVPEIQTDYDSGAGATFSDALSAPAKMLRGGDGEVTHPQHGKDASVIRQRLIETYMFFLSAPFLAIAVYYLLQIVASSVAEPVLVVIAFASGLMSESAVGAIMTFADDFLKQQKEHKNEAVPAVVAK